MNAKLTKEFLLNFGFEYINTLLCYGNDKININIYTDRFGNFDMFTQYAFPYKSYNPNIKFKVKNDWFHPETIKEFLDIFNEYSEYIKKLKEKNED